AVNHARSAARKLATRLHTGTRRAQAPAPNRERSRSFRARTTARAQDAKERRYPHNSGTAEASELEQVRVTGHDEIRVDLLRAFEDPIVRGIADDGQMRCRLHHVSRPADRLERGSDAVFIPIE